MLVVFVGEKDYKCTASSFTYGPCELHWTITICRVTNCKQCRESLQQPCSASSTHHTTHTHIHSRTIFFNVKNMKVSPPLMVNLFLFFLFAVFISMFSLSLFFRPFPAYRGCILWLTLDWRSSSASVEADNVGNGHIHIDIDGHHTDAGAYAPWRPGRTTKCTPFSRRGSTTNYRCGIPIILSGKTYTSKFLINK